MRCISCNKSIGTLFMVSIHEDYICKKCLKDKGFTKKELFRARPILADA